jgi:hypothetical protein
MNLWAEFQKLLPADPITYGEVLSASGGESRVQMPGGGAVVVVNGDSVAPGGHVWMQGGRIIGEAPDMPYYSDLI